MRPRASRVHLVSWGWKKKNFLESICGRLCIPLGSRMFLSSTLKELLKKQQMQTFGLTSVQFYYSGWINTPISFVLLLFAIRLSVIFPLTPLPAIFWPLFLHASIHWPIPHPSTLPSHLPTSIPSIHISQTLRPTIRAPSVSSSAPPSAKRSLSIHRSAKTQLHASLADPYVIAASVSKTPQPYPPSIHPYLLVAGQPPVDSGVDDPVEAHGEGVDVLHLPALTLGDQCAEL